MIQSIMISLLVPTRGRPANVRRMMFTARKAAMNRPVEFVFRVDDDDATFPEEVAREPDVTVVRGPRAVLSSLWNDCWRAASADIFMQCDDEAVFRTRDWDLMVEDAFARYPDRIAFVHGRDLHQPDGQFGALGFLHRCWTETIGYFTPPYFSCDYGDTWLNDVANMLDRRVYLPEVVIEHMHPIAGKGSWDKTHMERLQRNQRDDNPGLYASLYGKRLEDAEKLRKVML